MLSKAVRIQVEVFRVVKPCYERSGVPCCIHLQGEDYVWREVVTRY